MKATVPKLRSLEGEKIIACYQPTRLNWVGLYVLIAFLGIMNMMLIVNAPFGFTLIFLLIILTLIGYIEIKVRFTRYIITEKRCIKNWGFITRHFRDVLFKKIQNTYFTQGIIERLFGYGTVSIDSAGGHGSEVVFEAFVDFEEAHDIIKKQLG